VKMKPKLAALLSIAVLAAMGLATGSAVAAEGKKPNILFIVSDDTGYGDLGPYGGGEGRGMPTPNIDRMAAEGMTFFSFYAHRVARRAGRRCKPAGFPTVAV